jgi:hypothetical protein
MGIHPRARAAAVGIFTSASAQDANKSKFEPLTIQEQGSFAVGGKIITAPGTFDPIKQKVVNPAGDDLQERHCMAITHTSSTEFRESAEASARAFARHRPVF